jgi:hypothetical protein
MNPESGLMGVNNEFQVASAEVGSRRFHARHEASAVAIAEGHARVAGAVGVATVTSWPGPDPDRDLAHEGESAPNTDGGNGRR